MKLLNELTTAQSTSIGNSLTQTWISLFQEPSELTTTAFTKTLYSYLETKQVERNSNYINTDITLMAVEKMASILLVGNVDLMSATYLYLSAKARGLMRTQVAAHEELADQLDRSCFAGLEFAGREVRRIHKRKKERAERMQALLEVDLTLTSQERGSVDFPSIDHKLEIALKALTKAVREGKITSSSADLALLVMRDGKSQAEAAQMEKISRSAVSQRLREFAQKLKPIVANSEWV